MGNSGIARFEALVALLILAFAGLALSQVVATAVSSAGEAHARTQALVLAQTALEDAREDLKTSDFLAPDPVLRSFAVPSSALSRGNYQVVLELAPMASSLPYKPLSATVSWTSGAGNRQSVRLDTGVAWGGAGPGIERRVVMHNPTPTSVQARLGTPDMTHAIAPANLTRLADGTYLHLNHAASRSEWLDSDGRTVLLHLQHLSGVPQGLEAIAGRIFFDDARASGQVPIAHLTLRISGHATCRYHPAALMPVETPSFRYTTVPYICLVGAGWHGNVALAVNDSSTHWVVCVGDPGSQSPHTSAQPSGLRRYDHLGFAKAGAALKHDFLITRPGPRETCSHRMDIERFAQNAGKRSCIASSRPLTATACRSTP